DELEPRKRKPLDVVLRVGNGLGTEALLEMHQRSNVARLAHVVVPAARAARILDCDALEEVRRPRRSGRVAVREPAPVERALGMDEENEGSGRRTVHERDPDPECVPELASK